MAGRDKRANKGAAITPYALEETRVAVESLMAAVRRSRKGVGDRVQEELENLLSNVSQTQDELVRLKPEKISGLWVGSVQAELDAVIKHTENAADDFLQAVEDLQLIAASLPKKKANQIQEVTTRMLEASTFQDISGQRLNNAKSEVREIDNCVAAVFAVLGHEVEAEAPKEAAVLSDEDLLNGPQQEGAGSSQDDVDALLASFD